MEQSEADCILYLGTRNFALEKDEEIKAVKNAGFNIIIAGPSEEAYKNYNIDYFIQVALGKYDAATDIIVSYVHSNNLQVKGVVAWGDISVELAGIVGYALGLPCTTPEASLNVRNKANTRRLLTKLGSINPKHSIINIYNSFKETFKFQSKRFFITIIKYNYNLYNVFN